MADQLKTKPFGISYTQWMIGLILLATLALYLNGWPKQFTNWDDDVYILRNPLIQTLSAENLYKIATSPFYEANFFPVTLVSYALDYHFWKLNPTGYHLHNLALHLLSALALFLLLRKLHVRQEVVLLSTFLFAIHPVNVENVSWAAERKTLLAALFFFLSFHQYISYHKKHDRWSYLASVFFFVLSIFSKASTIVAPLIWLAYDYCYASRKVRQLCLYDKLPFLAAAEIQLFLSIRAAGLGHSLFSYHTGTLGERILSSGTIFAKYLALLFWPSKITALIYPSHHSAVVEVLCLGLVAAALILLFRVCRAQAFWAFWFAIFLVPVLNWAPLPIMMANRYLYLPEIGIWVLAGTAVFNGLSWCESFIENHSKRQPGAAGAPGSSMMSVTREESYAQGGQSRWLRFSFLATLTLWSAFLLFQSVQTTKVWQNSSSLWTDTAEKNPGSAIAYYNLGVYFQDNQQIERAAVYFRLATQLDAQAAAAYAGLGKYYLRHGNQAKAIECLKSAVAADPQAESFTRNLANLYLAAGNFKDAPAMFWRAITLDPTNPANYDRLIYIFLHTDRPGSAKVVAALFIRQFPLLPNGYYQLATAEEHLDNFNAALMAWAECRKRVSPDDPASKEIEQHITSLSTLYPSRQ